MFHMSADMFHDMFDMFDVFSESESESVSKFEFDLKKVVPLGEPPGEEPS
jgi:hypothetical protein